MIDITKPVKYKNPLPEEKDLIFIIKNYNEITNRCYIEVQNLPNWGHGLKPQFLVSADEIENC